MPCFEINDSTSEYPSEVSSTFYDSLGRAVETSVPTASPNPGDGKAYFTVTITEYNDASATTWTSQPFVVAVTPGQGGVTGTGWLDPATITDYNGHTPQGTTAFLDALGSTIAMRDPLYGTQSEPGVTCGQWLSGSYTACTNYSIGTLNSNAYITATGVDANGHVSESFADALGRIVSTQQFSGIYGGTLTAVQQTSILYTILGQATQVQVQDLQPQTNQTITQVTTTASYDSLGRLTTLNDPDRGTYTYTYDPDGHMLTDVSGTRTLGSNYDLLGRLGCLQDATPTINATGACTNGTHPYIQNTYDTSSVNWGSTNYPTGRLAQSIATTYYPGGSTMTTTQNFEYDERGRPITAQLSLSLPSAWNVSTLPVYQMATDYTDADQPLTTTTGTLVSGSLTKDSIMTQVYDVASGVQNGLGTIADNETATIASLVYNANALPDTITFYTSAGQTSQLATEQFAYDGDLRPAQTTATWQSGSGSSGQIYEEQRTYDATGNVSSLSTSLSPVPGKSNSGGTETQDFCYNEQNQLVWAGNSGTEPSPGNGTCGSAPLASGLNNAAYSNSFVYTHLGQLWKGPLNGSSTQYKYLYCSSGSNTPHELTGIFPIGGGASCSNQTGAVYTSSYDAWGNVTSRTYNGSTPTLSYDLLDHLVEWNSGSTNREWYSYDVSGQRTFTRSLTGSGTIITVYAFGNEYTYDGTGTFQSSIHYYTLAGRLIGELTANPGQNTNIFVTDSLGSVIATFSNVVGSAAVLANQAYGPYGTQRYKSGPMPTYTTKSFTGQYADSVTGLDYYNARYYDPVAGVFLSADTVQGNTAGMNPYAYVDGNPETLSDPTGKMYAPPPGSGGGGGSDGGSGGGSPGTGYPDPTPPPVDSCTQDNCSVTLHGRHFSLTDLKKNVQLRITFLQDFYAYFDPGYGNAEEAFISYLYKSGRLSESGYWKMVDFDVVRDQLLAAYDTLNQHTSQSTQVSGWLAFLTHPSSSSWWAAHNGSIDAGDQSARADGLYGKESGVEQHFINETIHVLSAVQSLSDNGIAYFSPQSSGTATLTAMFYPDQYNDSSTAFSLIKQAGAALIIGGAVGGVVDGPPGWFAGGAIGLGLFSSFL